MLNLPGFIDNTHFKYLNIDESILIGIVIEDYPKYTEFLQIMDSIPKDMNYDLSIFFRKQDTAKVLKELTYKISSSNAEMKSIHQNQIDIDLINHIKEDSIYLRKEIQLNNQDIFNITFVMTFFSNQYLELIQQIKLFQSKLYSKGILSTITNFRHLDSYLLTLPLNKNKNHLILLNERNFTTDSVSYNFPFYVKNVFDTNGVMFGFTRKDNRICNIDIFKECYINPNMCILGSSGSGKSYFVKLLIIRHFLMQRKQYIFDLEDEYEGIVKSLGGMKIDLKGKNTNYWNPLEVYEYEIKEEDWFERKLNKVCSFIGHLLDLKEEEKLKLVKEAIKDTYEDFHILNDKRSVFQESSKDIVYIDDCMRESGSFPTLLDLLGHIKNKRLANDIKEKIILKYEWLSKPSDFHLTEKLVVFKTNHLDQREFIVLVTYFLNEIKEISIGSMENRILYIDEVWKYLKKEEGSNLASLIFEYYKTLRKYHTSIITITQDITDFFSYENGNYGKGILNNCGFKLFFRMEFSDRKILENLSSIGMDEIQKIYKLDKGQSLLNFSNNQVILTIKPSQYEEKIMEGENEDIISFKE